LVVSQFFVVIYSNFNYFDFIVVVVVVEQDFSVEPVVISYTKNGVDLGTCFEIDVASLDGRALFPHALTKNTSFECNFGQKVYFPFSTVELNCLQDLICDWIQCFGEES